MALRVGFLGYGFMGAARANALARRVGDGQSRSKAQAS
jgi:hypothetical protein